MANTLNIALGHKGFPTEHGHAVDIFLSSRALYDMRRTIVIDDSYFGPHGSALSEYAQLMWLSDHFDAVVDDFEYVRIFQYRRFVSRDRIGLETNASYISYVTPHEIAAFQDDFLRTSKAELFNRPFSFPGGMLGQYASGHLFDDLLNFVKFLTRSGILNPVQAASFLREDVLIPACNMGVFKRETLRVVLGILRRAAGFLQSPDFVPQVGYHRRSLGFMMERFNSFILCDMMRQNVIPQTFGNHILISQSPVIENTIDI